MFCPSFYDLVLVCDQFQSTLSMGEMLDVSGPCYGLERVEEVLHIVSVGVALDHIGLVVEPGILHDA